MSVKQKLVDAATGLMRVPTKEFGSGLLKAAQEENRKVLQGQVIGKVQEILVHLQKQRDYKANVEANIVLLEAKAKAIEEGRFTLSPYGVITFTDDALNRSVVAMKECTNCGYQLRGRRDLDAV